MMAGDGGGSSSHSLPGGAAPAAFVLRGGGAELSRRTADVFGSLVAPETRAVSPVVDAVREEEVIPEEENEEGEEGGDVRMADAGDGGANATLRHGHASAEGVRLGRHERRSTQPHPAGHGGEAERRRRRSHHDAPRGRRDRRCYMRGGVSRNRRTPEHVRHPERYKFYSLEGVSAGDQESNRAAAIACMQAVAGARHSDSGAASGATDSDMGDVRKPLAETPPAEAARPVFRTSRARRQGSQNDGAGGGRTSGGSRNDGGGNRRRVAFGAAVAVAAAAASASCDAGAGSSVPGRSGPRESRASARVSSAVRAPRASSGNPHAVVMQTHEVGGSDASSGSNGAARPDRRGAASKSRREQRLAMAMRAGAGSDDDDDDS